MCQSLLMFLFFQFSPDIKHGKASQTYIQPLISGISYICCYVPLSDILSMKQGSLGRVRTELQFSTRSHLFSCLSVYPTHQDKIV